MSYKIEALPPFAKEVKYLAKRYKSLKEDILRLRDELLENPLSGTDLKRMSPMMRMARSYSRDEIERPMICSVPCSSSFPLTRPHWVEPVPDAAKI